jgi:hypothetical protein
MARFLKGQEAIDHLRAKGTLWAAESVASDKSRLYWRWVDNMPIRNDGATGWCGEPREVRTEPPAQQCVAPADLANALHDRIHPASGRLLSASPIETKPRAYAVGDIVIGSEAYRLVELGAAVDAAGGDSRTPAVHVKLSHGQMRAMLEDEKVDQRISRARRTLWNPDADEWRIVEPPKTITAEEARKVVAAGGAVARTFVAPESEWVEHTFRWYEQIVDGDSEWVVRRAAVEPAPQPSELTTEESWALRRTEEGQDLNWHERGLLVKALRRLETELMVTQARLAGVSQERDELRASAGKTPSLTAEELEALETVESHYAGSPVVLAKALRRLAGEK